MKRHAPSRPAAHRFGRQSHVSEHPREIGEPSQRMLERAARTGTPRVRDGNETIPYAELHCLSNFSFQRGASSASELFTRACRLGYAALAITDECSLAGIVRAYEAQNETGLRLIVGTEIRLSDGPRLVVLAADRDGYSDICRMITTGRRRSAKGEYELHRADVELLGSGVRVLWTPGPLLARMDAAVIDDAAKWIMQHFPARAWLAVELHRGSDDDSELARLRTLAERHGLPLVAAGDVHMHVRRRRALQDALVAIRLRCTVAEAGDALFANGERHLRRPDQLADIYPADLLVETRRIAAQCQFDMGDLNYEYPHELVPEGLDASAHLRQLTYAGAGRLWPRGIPAVVRDQLERELDLIAFLKYEHFFLTVEEIVNWARAQQPPILCQGRGSSANSAVCYCLGITAVNPETGNLLFERFLSKERNEPPDIDVDFEHERREEVIQHIFAKYGRARAALAATVISYRRKSAVRDLGRALGLADDALDQLGTISSRVPDGQTVEQQLRERGFDPANRTIRQLLALVDELRGFPRHLSQHVGGFVISEHPLHLLVPVENAAMPERTIIQWDKDDLETMKLLKVDCLALGMLTCLRKCIDLLHAHGLWTHGSTAAQPALHDIPQRDDAAVYDMICKADTVGVFQIESRAQMSMLPRLLPRTFYDLVIEVAIVRPGPIQGNMVHPYLRRRKQLEAIDYPQSASERATGATNSGVKDALERTLGVPIFQEQVMKLIQVVAGFTPGEADELRRAMAAWKRKGGLEKFHDRIRNGMLERGYDEAYFERI
ncbi:MAG: error-prone DNA polymerase, partial [Rudaea sp.]